MRAARVHRLGRDALDGAQRPIERAGVAHPALALFRQAGELLAQHRALPLAETVIGAVVEMGVEPLARQTPAVVDRARLALDVVVVGDDDAALARRHQLALLEAERPDVAQRADLAAFPFAAVGVRAVFDQEQIVPLGDGRQPVQVGGMAAHVHGDDRPRALGDGRFDQVRIDAVGIRRDIH